MNRYLSLDGAWRFREEGRAARRVRRWLPAMVPGTVHTDLLAAGRIAEPFHRMNELDQRWVEQSDWVYRRTFELPASFLRGARAVWLDFEGLDTFAAVRLNGRRIGDADNMFHPWRFDVRRRLRAGQNVLEVLFTSAARTAEALAATSSERYRAFFYQPRVHIRKAQCAGGWDWGPRFLTCGIWRPVRLVAVRDAEIRGVFARTRSLTDRRAVLDVDVEIESHVRADATLSLELTCRTNGAAARASIKRRLKRGTQTVTVPLTVDKPLRWWPAGMGEPHLYDLRTQLDVDGERADRRADTVGLRTVEVVREQDARGESFRFRVNGRDMFSRGANWIPDDCFIPRVTPERYRRRLTDARDVHMNMIRVWGGGIYEQPAFFEACDELGLMVWQDFMFSCGEYPEDAAMLKRVRLEAEHAVRRLRNHPSLVLWCGNNENHWGFDEWWPNRPRRYGEKIYHRVLPEVCRRLDPTRLYWPGSPFGGPTANDADHGDQHVWTVWGRWQPLRAYRQHAGRFISEFGFQAMPTAKTVRGYTARGDRRLFSPVIDHHEKADEGHSRIMRYLTGTFGLPRNLDDYVYLSQVQQMEAVRLSVEHWRRLWPDTAGVLYWQLNDCWPVASWSAIDYHGRPKALWYATRHFFAPAVVTLKPVDPEPYRPTDLEVWLTNDESQRRPVMVELSVWRFDGKRTFHQRKRARLPASGSQRLMPLRYDALGLAAPEAGLLHVRTLADGEVLSQTTHGFAPPRVVAWMDPEIRTVVARSDRHLTVSLTARRPARAVCLSADRWEGRFSDNFFDLMPGETRRVTFMLPGRQPTVDVFRKTLRIRTLADALK